MAKDKDRVTELALKFVKHFAMPEKAALDKAKQTVRWAKRHRRLAEKECNEGFNELDQKRQEVLEDSLRGIYYGPVKIDFSYDPRGYTVHLHFPTGDYNTMGGKESGWGV